MSVPQNGKIAQESYPPARAILRGFIHLHTLYVPSGRFLYHSIVLSWYSQVQVSTDCLHEGNVSSRNRWTEMNHVQTINRTNMSVPCTAGYVQCAYNDERIYTNWNTDFIVQTRYSVPTCWELVHSLYIPSTYFECTNLWLFVQNHESKELPMVRFELTTIRVSAYCLNHWASSVVVDIE